MNILGPVLYSVLLAGQLPAAPSRVMDHGAMADPAMTPATPGYTEHERMDHSGWGLSGTKGRLYFFGTTGFADCQHNGQRHVVSLVREADNTVPDPKMYMYYREIGSGDRWSISKHPEALAYAVYFQRANDRFTPQGKPKWTFYQSGTLIQDSRNEEHRSPIMEQGVARDQFVPRGATLDMPLTIDENRPAVAGSSSTRRAEVLYQPQSEGRRYVEPHAVQPSRCCGN